MTNRKLKLAAMSVALTACVAAQPMAAHAVEGPDADTDDTATPQAAPADEDAADSTTPDATDGEDEKQEEFTPPVNEEAKEEEQAPAFGPGTSTDDINIAYKPAVKPEEPGESGDAGESGNAGDAGDAGDTDDTKQPDGTYMEGDVIDNSKKDETTGEAGQVIGSATKEETPESSSSTTVVDPDAEVKKTETVGKDEDGNTTITTKTETTGTETTTTTGTGTAKSDTKETEKGDKIDLNEELKNKDGVVENPTWETKTDDTLGGYTVDKVDTAEDGNSKTLTLKKTDTTEEKKMSAEDIAKLLDVPEGGVEKKTDDEGNTTYILKKEETSTDENGNTVTRVTYYEIDNKTNSVKTTTTTTLVLKVEKGPVDGKQNVTETPMLPSIIVTNENDHNDSFTITAEQLDKMLSEGTFDEQNKVYIYKDGNRTYKITKTDVKSGDYTYEDIAELLNKKLGTDGYTADDNGVYYKGNQLSITDMNAAHMVLSYTVKVDEERYNKGQYENDHAKADAEEAAKLAAIKNALKEAAKKAGINTADTNFDEELKKITSTEAGRITFTYTDDDNIEHEVTFYYNGAEITGDTISTSSTDPKVDGKDSNDIKDVKDNTVTGTAYVTGGSESWSKTETIAGSGSILGNDYTKLPEGVREEQDEREGGKADGRITKITIGDDVYTFTYTDNATLTDEDLANLQKDAAKKGLTLGDITNTDFTIVSWTKTTTTPDEKKSNIDLSDDKGDKLITEVPGEDGSTSYTIKVNGTDVTGFQMESQDENSTTYTKTVDGKTTTITVTKTQLSNTVIEGKLRDQYNVAADTTITLREDADGNKYATWTNADKSVVKVYYTGGYTESLTVTEKADHNLNATKVNQLVSLVQDKMNDLDEGDKIILKGKDAEGNPKTVTINCTGKNQFTIIGSDGTISGAVSDVAVKEALKKTIEKIAQNTNINYDNLTPEDIWNLLDIQQMYGDGEKTPYSDGTDSYWPEYGFENISGTKNNLTYGESYNRGQGPTHFDSINLDAEVSISGGKDANGNDITYDGVLLNDADDALSFKYGHKEEIAGWVDMSKYPDQSYTNSQKWPGQQGYDETYKKEELHTKDTVTNANLADNITMANGSVWNKDINNGKGGYETGSKLVYACNGNTLTGKGFYNVSGKVAYDKAGSFTDSSKAAELLAQLKKEAEDKGLTSSAQIVALPNKNGGTDYVVYRNVTTVNAIGYMTASANTNYESNSESSRKDSQNPWGAAWTPGSGAYWGKTNPGGYDLRIQGLQLVDGKVQGNYGVKYGLDMSVIKSSNGDSSNILTTGDYTTTTVSSDTDKYGSYTASYTKDYEWKKGTESEVKGEGTGSYKTFTEILRSFFKGESSTNHDEGGFKYSHRTPDEVTTSAVSKTTETKTEAQVGYKYTTIETRKVPVTSEVTVVVPPVDPDTPEIPDTPDTPVQDETPDEVVTPETPELPPVQDATPDEVVLPADPELPAVQDATALPQTGVNWFTALGMAFSGMLLMIAGAFTSLKYKEKH